MRVTRWGRAWAAAVCGLALLAAPRAHAGAEWGLTAGTTFGVNGEPGLGGVAAAVSLMWPFEERYSFGLAVHADDQGTGVTELFDPNTGQSLGTVGDLHRWTYGVSWRGEARLADSRKWQFRWGADFGYARQELDLRGEVQDAISDVMLATGPTFLWKMMSGQTLGLTAAYKHAFVNQSTDPTRTTDWASLALTWRWARVPKEQ